MHLTFMKCVTEHTSVNALVVSIYILQALTASRGRQLRVNCVPVAPGPGQGLEAQREWASTVATIIM